MENTIFTIGHSVRSMAEFLECLKENKIDILVDVRTYPYSRYCPQYNKKNVKEFVGNIGINYKWHGNNLGGKKKNVDYYETIEKLLSLIKRGHIICLMCSERDYRKCHRYQMLTPEFIKSGVRVNHIDGR